MNNNLKVILGTVSGIIIGGLTVVGANQAIQAIQNTEIKINLNGQVQEFKDETTGEIQYPITYHDRTYLPLRNVAQLSGLNVDYDAKANMAMLYNSADFDNKKMIQNDIETGAFKTFYDYDIGLIAIEYRDVTYDEAREAYDVNKLLEITREIGIKDEDVYKELNGEKYKTDTDWYDSSTNTMNLFVGDSFILMPNHTLRDLTIVENDDVYTISGVSYDPDYAFGVGIGYNEVGINDSKAFFDYCVDNKFVSPVWSFEYKVKLNSNYKYSKYKYLSINVQGIYEEKNNKSFEECVMLYKLAKLDSYKKDIIANTNIFYLNTNEFENAISISIYHIDNVENNLSHHISRGNRYIGIIKNHKGDVIGDFEIDGKTQILKNDIALSYELKDDNHFVFYNYISENDTDYIVEKTTITADEKFDNKYDFENEQISLSKKDYKKNIKGIT